MKAHAWEPGAVERDLAAVLARFEELQASGAPPSARGTPYLADWFAPSALAELLRFRDAIAVAPGSADLARIVLAERALRAPHGPPPARLPDGAAAHALPLPQHRRTCEPTRDAAKFLRRYTADTARRVRAFSELRRDVAIDVHHADARSVAYGRTFDALITSPPYPGRIDYHEQHRYAFELLDLVGREDVEIGRAGAGRSRAAVARYVDDVAAVLGNARAALRPGAPVVIVVEDALGLYGEILERAGLELEERRARHVNRRTGARGGEYFEWTSRSRGPDGDGARTRRGARRSPGGTGAGSRARWSPSRPARGRGASRSPTSWPTTSSARSPASTGT